MLALLNFHAIVMHWYAASMAFGVGQLTKNECVYVHSQILN